MAKRNFGLDIIYMIVFKVYFLFMTDTSVDQY